MENVLKLFKTKERPVQKAQRKLKLVWDSTMNKAKEIGTAIRQELPKASLEGDEIVFCLGTGVLVLAYQVGLVMIIAGAAAITWPVMSIFLQVTGFVTVMMIATTYSMKLAVGLIYRFSRKKIHG